MPHIPTDRSNVAQTALVYAVNLAALTLLAGMLAYWGSIWLAASDRAADAQPGSQTVAHTVPGAGTSGSAANDLFGIAQREQNSTAATSVTINLLGVVADAEGRKGYAVLRVDEKQILAAPEGEDIAPGVVLAEVHPYHVVLERNGLRETLALPETNSSIGSPILPKAGVATESPQVNE